MLIGRSAGAGCLPCTFPTGSRWLLFLSPPPSCPHSAAPHHQVLKLLQRRERWLVVAAIRFLRTALSMKVRALGALLLHACPAWPCASTAWAPAVGLVEDRHVPTA